MLVVLVVLVLSNIGFNILALSKLRDKQNRIAQRIEEIQNLLDNYLDDWCVYIQLNSQRASALQASIEEKKELCKKLIDNIKDIPEEITVKNVLNIP